MPSLGTLREENKRNPPDTVVRRQEGVDCDRGAQNTSREIAVGPCEQKKLAVLFIFDSDVELDNQAILHNRSYTVDSDIST